MPWSSQYHTLSGTPDWPERWAGCARCRWWASAWSSGRGRPCRAPPGPGASPRTPTCPARYAGSPAENIWWPPENICWAYDGCGQDLVSTHNTRAGCIQTDLLRAAAAAPGANVPPHWRELKWRHVSQKSETITSHLLQVCCYLAAAVRDNERCLSKSWTLHSGHWTLAT